MINLLADLNNKQRQAVTGPLGPVLVLAGAGSGKTRVLTYRIVYLLKQKFFKPSELLALTFTNKAAGEMRGRIEKLLSLSLRGGQATKQSPESGELLRSTRNERITMGTFHSVCARILRKEIENLAPASLPALMRGGREGHGYDRNFTIYDEDDSHRVIKQILIEKHLLDKFRPQVFRYYIGQAKNRLAASADLNLESSFFAETLQEVSEAYAKQMRDQNALDFDDLLKLTCELFISRPKVLGRYQERFKYILVDEYQDTNHAQYVLLKLLVEAHQNLFVVGDDAQSIYGFRGANMQNILDFKKDFPKAKVAMLEQNYRSTQNILDGASQVIRLSPYQYEKNLWTKNEGGSKINLYEAGDEVDESEWVVRRILHAANSPPHEEESSNTPILNRYLRGARPGLRSLPIYRPINGQAKNLNDYVVLYRTHAQSRPFEEILLPAGIPYQIVGGIKFYERKEIKDLLSYLRILVNPRDLVSLSRVINTPARGIGPSSLKQIIKALNKYGFSYQRISLNLEREELQAKALSGAKDFFDLLARAVKMPKTRNLLELLELLLLRSGYKDSLLDGSKEGEVRWENIEELFNVAAKYKREPWDEGVKSFLEETALMTDLDSVDDQGNKLTLMTLHSAKGLEFPDVFLVGLEEGLLPHIRSLDSPEELAEEIRLAYVGMTRAKQDLYLSYARQRRSYGEMKRCVASRILKAIPKKLLQKIPNPQSLK